MKQSIVVLGLAILVVVLPRLVGQAREADKDKDKEKKVAALMERKLHAAQKVLDGIATGHFDKILKNAEDLKDISKEASFRVLKTPTYELYSNEFQRNATALIKSTKTRTWTRRRWPTSI